MGAQILETPFSTGENAEVRVRESALFNLHYNIISLCILQKSYEERITIV